ARLLADRVQAFVLHEGMQRLVFGPHPGLRPDPLGLSLDRGRGIADLQAEEPASPGVRGAHAGTPIAASTYSPAKAEATASTMSAGETSAPTTSLTVVTPASVMPQGMMPLKPDRVLLQLIAKPCSVTPCCTRTPMAATLSSESGRRTQTPLRPAT